MTIPTMLGFVWLLALLHWTSSESPSLGLNERLRFVASKSTPALDVYHFDGLAWDPVKLFADVYLHLNISDSERHACQIYQGANRSQVEDSYSQDQRLFGIFRGLVIWRSKQLPPFHRTFIGVATAQAYEINVVIWRINYMRFFGCVIALVLFCYARVLVRKALFYYTSGCALGLLASFLVVAIVVQRFAPRASFGLPMLVGGWSFSLYLVYAVWTHLTVILLQYQKLVAVYLVTVMLLSFAVCYRAGPPTDVRSQNLAQWALQALCIAVIYATIQIPEISLSLIAGLIAWTVMPEFLARFLYKIWLRMFPVQRRLLTELEYEEQGQTETQKALRELRSFCNSPGANAWRIAARVKDPKRLASFLSGTSDHVTDEESFLHDEISADCDIEHVLNRAAGDVDEDDDDWNLEDYGNGRLNGHLPTSGRRDETAGKPRVSLSASRLASGQSMSSVRNKFSNTPQMSRSFAGAGDDHQRDDDAMRPRYSKESLLAQTQRQTSESLSRSFAAAAPGVRRLAESPARTARARRSMPVRALDNAGNKNSPWNAKRAPALRSSRQSGPGSSSTSGISRQEMDEYLSDDSD